MRTKLLSISTLLLSCLHLAGQELYIPPGSGTEDGITITDGAVLTAGGNLINTGNIVVEGTGEVISQGNTDNSGSFTVEGAGGVIVEGTTTNAGRIDIQTVQGEFIGMGNVNTSGQFFNSGTISLFGDWANTGVFNTSAGKMVFLGAQNQMIQNNFLELETLEVNKVGMVTLSGDSVWVTDELSFIDGVLTMSPDGKFILRPGAEISHDPLSSSYYEGEILAQGALNRTFPVGDGNYYGTVELFNILGATNATEYGVSLTHQNPQPPEPSDDLIGVSGENAWRVNLRRGRLDSFQVQIDYIAEDLENFDLINDINRKFEELVIAVSDTAINGPYRSLGGMDRILDADSLTQGIIASERNAGFASFGSKYFAVALAPKLDPAGQIYFPNVFSPAASDRDNQTYKVFGHFIANEPFRIEIYNRFSILVYSADTFEEANTIGWNGRNTNGREEPTGVYYVFVTYAYQRDLEDIKTYTGPIYLQR